MIRRLLPAADVTNLDAADALTAGFAGRASNGPQDPENPENLAPKQAIRRVVRILLSFLTRGARLGVREYWMKPAQSVF